MTTPYPFVAGQILTAAQLNDIQNLPISDKTTSYVLTATDVYKRTMMNSASATTITVNNSIFTVGDVIQVANKGAGTCTITAGAGVTINTSGSLALAQYGGGYLLCLSASTFTFFNLGAGANYGTATGGTSSSITVGGINYTLLTFTTDGNLVVSKAGLFDCLLFGGGAGGMQYTSGAAGGGGAGGYLIETVYLNAATYTVDVGAGGATSQLYSSGAVSSIGAIPDAITAAGGCGFQLSGGEAVNFGIGCGNGSLFTTSNLTVSNIQGFKGGGAAGGGGVGGGGGGGGGVTQAGFQGVNGTTGGAGGAGYNVSAFIGGSTLFKGGGGGGGGSVTGGAGGSSVGGAGGSGGAGSAAAANTASGGGGGGGGAVGGAGGSGIIYVRFKV